MKATNHNGRSGKHGAYNPKHNDRQFDVAKSDHIDAVRMLENVNWDYQRGIRLFKQENDNGSNSCMKYAKLSVVMTCLSLTIWGQREVLVI